MKKILFLSIFQFLVTHLLQAQQLEWIHPQPGGFTILEINFTSDQQGYAFNANGDLFETTNQGASWQLKQHFPDKTIFRRSGKNGLIAGGSGDIYVSQNYGEDWEKISFITNQQIAYADIVNDSTFYLASNQNLLYRTTDRGKSWTALDCKGNIQSLEFITVDTGWVGLSNTNILYTTDRGQTWTPQATSYFAPSNVTYINFTSSGIGYAFRHFSDLLRTVDYGKNWIASNFDDEIFDIYFINDSIGFACTEYGLLYKTTDHGISWNQISKEKAHIYGNDFKTVYFLNEQIGFVAGNRGRLLKTIDGGENWTAYSEPYYTLNDLSFATDNIFYTASGQHLYKSNNGGVNWEKIPMDLEPTYGSQTTIRNIHFFDEKNGLVVADDDSRIYKTSDGGLTWDKNPLLEIGGENVMGLQFFSDSVGYLFNGWFQSTNVVRTEDGGKTWTKIWPPYGSEIPFQQIHFVNQQTGHAIRERALYKTTTGGSSWQLVLEEDHNYLNSFDFVNDSVGFITGINNLLKKTSDGGKTWQKIRLPYYEHLTAIKLLNEDIGLMCSEDGSLYFTYDGGLTWDLIAKDKYLFNKIKLGPGNLFYLFGENGQLASFNPRGVRIKYPNSTYTDSCSLELKAELAALFTTATDIHFEIDVDGITYSIPALATTGNHQKLLLSGKVNAPIQPSTTYQWRLRYTTDGAITYGAYQTLTTPRRLSAPVISQADGLLHSSATTGNQWFLNGILLPGATGNTFKPEQNGEYQVQQTIGNCVSTISYGFNYMHPTKDKIHAFPNPVVDILTIRSMVGNVMDVQLLNSSGTLLFNQSTIQNSMQIDMSGYLSGSYFIRVYFPVTGISASKLIYKK